MVPSLTGGLVTGFPSHRLAPGQSPEMSNIVLGDFVAERRGGFVPLIKERCRLNCLQNVGYSRSARKLFNDTADNVLYLQVPGLGIAGHRSIFNTIGDAYTIDLFFAAKNLITDIGVDTDFGGTPQGVKIRPIISKGPLKKTEELNAAFGYGEWAIATPTAEAGNGPTWVTDTSGSVWGSVDDPGNLALTRDGMPFCIYLWNKGTTASPEWRLRFALHAKDDTDNVWWLKMIELSTLDIFEDGVYHVVAAASSKATMILRAGRVIPDDGATTTYVTGTNDLSASDPQHNDLDIALSWCPVQVFDCPQYFVESDNETVVTADSEYKGTTTKRPGLELNTATHGNGNGYFYNLRRFEGCVEDIAIWKGNKIASDNAALDRLEKLDPLTAGTDLVALWAMTKPGTKIVKDEAGRGSDLMLAPAGPAYVEGGSARPDGGWYFNGLTSFAQCDLGDTLVAQGGPEGNPNWRTTTDGSQAWLRRCIQERRPWGVQVTFWMDSIEPNFEQVLVEIHDALRVSIGVDGKLSVYVPIVPGTPATNANGYTETPVRSSTILQPGCRYNVTVFRGGDEPTSTTPGSKVRIYINGQLDQNGPAGILQSNYSNHGGLTWGMGSAERIHIDSSAPPETALASETHAVNFDHRSGFVGTIESARLIGGAPIQHPPYKDDEITDEERAEDSYLIELLWEGGQGGNIVQSHSAGHLNEPLHNPQDATLPAAGTLHNRQGFAIGFADAQRQPQQRIDSTTKDGHSNSMQARLAYALETAALPQVNYNVHVGLKNSAQGGWNSSLADPLDHVHMRVFHTVGKWVFNRTDEQDEARYTGWYMPAWEVRSNWNDPNYDRGQDHVDRWTHIQETDVKERYGRFGHVLKGCIESDPRREFRQEGVTLRRPGMPRVGTKGVTFLRPYPYRAPLELQPRFTAGIVRPRAGQAPISMIADWQVPSSLERFRVIACGRQAYWAKPAWRVGTPFTADANNTKSLWLFGQHGEYARCLSTDENNQNVRQVGSDWNLLDISVWVYPERLDGKRVILFKKGGQKNSDFDEVNYMIWSEDGAVHMLGTYEEGGVRKTWRTRSVSGTPPTPIQRIPIVKLRLREWNHIHVRIGNAYGAGAGLDRLLWINGTLISTFDDWDVPLATLVDLDRSNVTGFNELFIGGLAAGTERLTFNALVTRESLVVQAWHGQISEVRQLADAADPNFPVVGAAGKDGTPPRTRAASDANTYYLLPLNEGDAWGVTNSAVAASSGKVHAKELIVVQDNLDESSLDPYRWVVFRDRLYFTNGKARPQELLFTRLSDPEGPFRCHDAGVRLMPLHRASSPSVNMVSTITPIRPTATTTVFAIGNGLYQFWITAVDEDGRESEPTILYEVQLTGGPTHPDQLILRNLPRSTHPRVIGRWIYVSPNGGGTPLKHKYLADNVTRDVEIYGVPSTGDPLVNGFRLPVPRAKHIDVARGSLIVADLSDEANGPNAFAYSNTEEPVQFTTGSTVVIDSRDGKPVIGIETHLGRSFFSKRDSIWAFAFAGFDQLGEAEAYLTIVDRGPGVGAGSQPYDNLIFGAGDRGVYRFDGSNALYWSTNLEGEWALVDRSDRGLLAMWGAYYHPDSQYWLSVRRLDQKWNDRIYVLHTNIGQHECWTRLDVPEHSYLQEVLDEASQSVKMLMGTTAGHLLEYRPDVQSDIAAAWAYDNVTVKLVDTISIISADRLTLTMPGPLDTLWDGLVGAKVKFASGEERTIVRNTSLTITVDAAVSAAVLVGQTLTIGGYLAFWTTPWHEPQAYGKGLRVHFVDLDWIPTTTTNVVLEWINAHDIQPAIAAFLAGVGEFASADASRGYLKQPIPVKEQQHGRYFRMRVATDGVQKPFALSGYGLRFFEIGIRGGPVS